jgi:hypothetical protein
MYLKNHHQFNANSFGRRFLFAADASGARWSSNLTCDVTTTTTLQSMDHSTYLRRTE